MEEFVAVFKKNYETRLISAGFDFSMRTIQRFTRKNIIVNLLTIQHKNGDSLCIENFFIDYNASFSVFYCFPDTVSAADKEVRTRFYAQTVFGHSSQHINMISEAYFKAGLATGIFVNTSEDLVIPDSFIIQHGADASIIKSDVKIICPSIRYNPNLSTVIKYKKISLKTEVSIYYNGESDFNLSFLIRPKFLKKSNYSCIFDDTRFNPSKFINVYGQKELNFTKLPMIQDTFETLILDELNSIFPYQSVDLHSFTKEEINKCLKLSEIIDY